MSTTAPWPTDDIASHLSQLAVDDYQRSNSSHSPSASFPGRFPYDNYLYFASGVPGVPGVPAPTPAQNSEYTQPPTPAPFYPDLGSPMASLQNLPSLQSLSPLQNLINSSLAFEPYPEFNERRQGNQRIHQGLGIGMQMQGVNVQFRNAQPLTAQSTGQGFFYERQWAPTSPNRGRHARLGSNPSPRRRAYNDLHGLNIQQLVYPASPPAHGHAQAHAQHAQQQFSLAAAAGQFNPYAPGFPRRFDAARSSRLDEFRRHRNSRMELVDIAGHICEFAGDQHGSRFIQNKLETASAEDRAMVFDEIMPNAYTLMTDVFGNYVIQKLFEYGDAAQKTALAKTMETHVLHLSMQMYGCRVVQKALEHVLYEQRDKLVAEIAGHVIECVKSANANHVIQRLIALDPPAAIIDAFKGHVRELSCHPFGCRVLQKSFEILKPAKVRGLLNELHMCAGQLMVDQFGNYVVQSIITDAPDREADRDKVIERIKPRIYELSRHKFASNVVEKAIKFASPADRRQLIAELIGEHMDNPEERVASLLRDGYGNFPVQTALAEADADQRERLLAIIVPLMPNIRHTPCGRRLEAKINEYDPKGLTPALSHSLSASSVNSPDLGSDSEGTVGTVGTVGTLGTQGTQGTGKGMLGQTLSAEFIPKKRQQDEPVIKMLF